VCLHELLDDCQEIVWVGTHNFLHLGSALVKVKCWHGTNPTFSGHVVSIIYIDLDELNVRELLLPFLKLGGNDFARAAPDFLEFVKKVRNC
jgi:hypothetical protein